MRVTINKSHYIKGIALFAVSCIFIVLKMSIPMLEWIVPRFITIGVFILILVEAFGLRDEFSCTLRIHKKVILYMIPAVIEISILLLVPIIFGDNLVANHAKVSDYIKYFLVHITTATFEELTTSFGWIIAGTLILQKMRRQRAKYFIILWVSSLLFMMLHIPNLMYLLEIKTTTMGWDKILWTVAYLINILLVGLYIKSVYMKTRSLVGAVIIHSILLFNRGMSPYLDENISMIFLWLVNVFYLIAYIVIELADKKQVGLEDEAIAC